MIAVAHLVAAAPVVWYGPVTVVFKAPTSGNPYDPVQNDVRVQFQGPKGTTESRLAYYDGRVWKATLLSRTKGAFRPFATVNGRKVANLPPMTLKAIQPHGFVRLGGPKGFRMDDGTPYWPLGHNLAWAGGPIKDLPTYLRKMGQEGLNWSRIWANHWDDKNPFWPMQAPKPKPGEMSPEVLRKWDAIVAASEQSGIRFQLTLFHHGPWSSRVNSNWGENPWNAKNGGWLQTPSDFFTDPKAQALSRAWLRYAIARWGHSPAIMAWELFNEVEWTDPNYEKREEVVGTWHDAMADYIRSLDPYHHLVTTSSRLDLPIYRKMDFLQPHGYPPSVEALVAAAPKMDKPFFFGEVGPGQLDGSRPVQVQAIRDGIYTALLMGQAGAAQFWTWDRVASDHMEPEFARAAKLVKLSGFDRLPGTIYRSDLDSGLGGNVELRAGAGWETSKQFAYRLPEESHKLGRLSGYLQGKAHPEMQPQPVTLTFTTPKALKATVEVTGTASTGGELTIDVDGTKAFNQSFAGGTRFREPVVATVDVPAGTHTLTLRNDGSDWVQLGKITIPGIAPRAIARGIRNGSRAALRVKGEKGLSVVLRGLGLKDGRYTATLADLDGGDTTVPLVIRGGAPNRRVTLPGSDVFIVVK
ncbi:hypothetical protein EON82_02765, partial [bacterium]